ncbi:MAG: hypothetical protein HQM08_14590 [Candidatus Riflebacteria bacterium]|nr:hypothetical protein [Candidatus Riflebacteria bacterium]
MEKSPYEQIKSFDEFLWREGLKSLSVEHTPEAARALKSLFSDKIWKKREATAKVLVAWGSEVVPILIDDFDEKNPDEVYWVLYVIGHFETPEGTKLLERFLKSPDSEFRGFALRSISLSLNKKNSRTLLNHLNDQNWAIRKLAFEKLMLFGLGLLDDLRNELNNYLSDPPHALVALFIKIGGKSIIHELSQMYENGSFSMRYSVIVSLEKEDSPEFVDFLIQALSDSSWVIRKKAAEIIFAKGPKVFDRLSSWFSKGDSMMKYQIIGIIVDLLGEKAIPLLKRFLGASDQEYKILAIDCFSRLPGDEATKLLIKCLSDPHRIVSDFASECLAKKNKLNLDLLLENLNSDDENFRFLIIKTIGAIGGLALNPIIKILKEGSKQEKLFLVGILQKISPNDKLIEALVYLLGDPSWPVRNSASQCLKAFGERSVRFVVKVLNSSNEDAQFWAGKILQGMGHSAVSALSKILDDGADGALVPHIVSALIALNDSEAMPTVIRYLEKCDEIKIKFIFENIQEISSREVVEGILNLLGHPDDRVLTWLSILLRKVKRLNLRKEVLLGLNLSDERSRFVVIDAAQYWDEVSEPEIKSLIRQLEVEKVTRSICGIVRILRNHPLDVSLEFLQGYIETIESGLMLDLMLIISESKSPKLNHLLAEVLKRRSQLISEADVEKVGVILGRVFQNKPEGIVQGLASSSMPFRLCCVVALEQIHEKKVALMLMDNLNQRDDPKIVKRAVKILSEYFFTEDFRLKGAVTDFLLNLGPIISEPMNEVISDLENEIDRKALIDLIDSVGGTVDPEILKRKKGQKLIISDAALDNVLERRKKAMEELEKYDKIIQTSHTQELTIMFTDVKGYTTFSSKASLSEVMSMLKEHDEILIPSFEKHSGKVLKKIGDAFLVVFEDPSKSVLAGIEIQRNLKERNATVSEERKLAIRIAINTGPVIRKESDVFGEAVNVASRLEGIADAEEIVISESTFKLIDKEIFELKFFGEHALKGLEHKILAYKVKW